MKKNYKFTWALGLSLAMSTVAFSQAINEGFDDITTLTAAGWTQQNLSTPVGTLPNWTQGGAAFTANSGAATSYINVNFNSVAGANIISNWLFTPNRTFNNGDVISFYAIAADAGFPDRLQVLFSGNGTSVNAGTTNTSVGDFTTVLIDINPTLVAGVFINSWVQYTYTFTGLSAPTSGRVAFRYFVTDGGPSGNNSDIIGIDDYVYTPFGTPAAPNVTATNPALNQYTIVPVSQIAPIALSATINNVGTATTNDATLTVNVYQAPSTTPVFTQTSPNTTIVSGASSVINFPPYTPFATAANYLIEYISASTGNTITSADTTTYIFQVSDSTYARDYANVEGVTGIVGVGAGAGQNTRLGQTFNLLNADTMTSVDIFIANTNGLLSGQPLQVHIYATAAGVPTTTLLGSTDVITMDTTTNTLWNLTISGGLILPAGMYAIAVEENDSNITIGNTNKIFNTNTVFVKWNGNAGGAWTAVEVVAPALARPFVLRPNFGKLPLTIGINEIANANFTIYPNPTTENILVNNVVAGSNLEIVNALGQIVHSEVLINTKSNINVANYNNGLYMIRITNGKKVSTNTFIKQ